jgi:hypothetical protein
MPGRSTRPLFFICLRLAGTLISCHAFTNVISHPRVHSRILPDHKDHRTGDLYREFLLPRKVSWG